MSKKRLKDPVYGYITIEEKIMSGIVDTAPFQRLRRITQTSYAPLYSSAVHNRFVHSLGVYHLGMTAAVTLQREVCEVLGAQAKSLGFDKERLDRLTWVFSVACLLHDVGHAPFSHTGEGFYLDDNQEYGTLHTLLTDAVNTEQFRKDVPTAKSSSAAPHEIMSAIVGLKEYGSIIGGEEDKEFFARCITGYKYSEDSPTNNILNSYVQLLNSKVIDVDKLDYLIRDAYTTGFYTVQIDYDRLLRALTVVRDDGGRYQLAYYKSAISVVENVVYAHDSEKKWIQNHPVILYECYILQHIMKLLSEEIDGKGKKLFSIESLGVAGQTFDDGTTIRLLCDDDVIHLMKMRYEVNDLVKEYFERSQRLHPLWKSEAEYTAFFLRLATGGEMVTRMERAMKATSTYLAKNTENWVINTEFASALEKELKDLADPALTLDEESKTAQRDEKQQILKVVKALTAYAASVGYHGDFVLLQSSQFNSSFLKPDFNSTKIVFPGKTERKAIKFSDTIATASGTPSDREDYFYLFCNRSEDGGKELDAAKLCKELYKTFID